MAKKNRTVENKERGKAAQKHEKPAKESRFFLVKDQGEGAARIAIIILKLAEIALTTIFALCLGIFAPLVIWGGEDAELMSGSAALPMWFASSVLYILGMFTLMLGHSKIASVIHAIAAAGTLITYSSFTRLFAEVPDSRGPSELYLPCLFITIITLIVMLLINFPKWLQKRIDEENAPAPSVLGGEYRPKSKK